MTDCRLAGRELARRAQPLCDGASPQLVRAPGAAVHRDERARTGAAVHRVRHPVDGARARARAFGRPPHPIHQRHSRRAHHAAVLHAYLGDLRLGPGGLLLLGAGSAQHRREHRRAQHHRQRCRRARRRAGHRLRLALEQPAHPAHQRRSTLRHRHRAGQQRLARGRDPAGHLHEAARQRQPPAAVLHRPAVGEVLRGLAQAPPRHALERLEEEQALQHQRGQLPRRVAPRQVRQLVRQRRALLLRPQLRHEPLGHADLPPPQYQRRRDRRRRRETHRHPHARAAPQLRQHPRRSLVAHHAPAPERAEQEHVPETQAGEEQQRDDGPATRQHPRQRHGHGTRLRRGGRAGSRVSTRPGQAARERCIARRPRRGPLFPALISCRRRGLLGLGGRVRQ